MHELNNAPQIMDQMANAGLDALGLLKGILASQAPIFPSKSRNAPDYVSQVLLQVSGGKPPLGYWNTFR